MKCELKLLMANFNFTNKNSFFQYHENNLCPDRHSFHAKQYEFEVGPQLTTPVHHIDLPEPTENWDDVSDQKYSVTGLLLV